ncbi:MAG: hypothetical protein GY934_22150 [Gammaproteobacteria bacterium]|nr:hypothetical protein [Gammaproteobacteria bacterium]
MCQRAVLSFTPYILTKQGGLKQLKKKENGRAETMFRFLPLQAAHWGRAEVDKAREVGRNGLA